MTVQNLNTPWRKVNTKKSNQHSYPLVNVPYHTAPYSVQLYENRIQVKQILLTSRRHKPPLRTKNDITTLSYKSRLNSIKTLCSIQTRFLHQPTFVTFTYHNSFPTTHAKIKRDLDIFLKRVRRRYPDLQYFYNVEVQKRGAPHFHFLFFEPVNKKRTPTRILIFTLSKIWTKLNHCGCSDCSRFSVHLRDVDNIKRATSYISKYMSKDIQNQTKFTAGRRWNVSTNLYRSAYSKIDLDEHQEAQLKKLVINHLIMGSDSSFRYATKILDPGTYFLLVDIDTANIWLSEVLHIDVKALQKITDIPPP